MFEKVTVTNFSISYNKYKLYKSDKLSAAAFVGPNFGWNIGATKTTTINTKETAVNTKAQTRGFDLSGVGGIWLEYDANESMTVLFSGRYNYGFLNAEKSFLNFLFHSCSLGKIFYYLRKSSL